MSDTGIVEREIRLPAARQIPKTCILSPDLAVAFSGSIDLAIRYLRDFPHDQSPNVSSTNAYFLKCHLESEQSVDFLLLYNRPVPKIVPVRAGKIQAATKAAWTGEQSAFEAFQKYNNSRRVPACVSPLEVPEIVTVRLSERHKDNETFRLLGTMRYVLLDPQISSVFGDAVAVNNVEGTFQYRPYTIILTERRISLVIPRSFSDQIAPERAELRNYVASCFVAPPEASTRILAYHFPRGKLTYLYSGAAGQPITCRETFTDKNMFEIQESVKERFGTDLIGTLTLRQPPDASYGMPGNKWKIASAGPSTPFRA